MAPPKAGATTSGSKKSHTKQATTPIQEETPEAFDPVNFPRVYAPPRKPTTKQVRLHKEVKYDMVTPVILPGVTVKGDRLGVIGSLRFSDRDLTDLKKFPELA
jgi:hypothetical protein